MPCLSPAALLIQAIIRLTVVVSIEQIWTNCMWRGPDRFCLSQMNPSIRSGSIWMCKLRPRTVTQIRVSKHQTPRQCWTSVPRTGVQHCRGVGLMYLRHHLHVFGEMEGSYGHSGVRIDYICRPATTYCTTQHILCFFWGHRRRWWPNIMQTLH